MFFVQLLGFRGKYSIAFLCIWLNLILFLLICLSLHQLRAHISVQRCLLNVKKRTTTTWCLKKEQKFYGLIRNDATNEVYLLAKKIIYPMSFETANLDVDGLAYLKKEISRLYLFENNVVRPSLELLALIGIMHCCSLMYWKNSILSSISQPIVKRH